MAKHNILNSTIGRKIIMSLSGLFLCLFIVEHLVGNMLLLLGDEGRMFNIYSNFMGHNFFIRIVEVLLAAALIFHVVYAIIITRKNKQARNSSYAVNNRSENSTWFSRNMGLIGAVILVFLILHLANFFVAARINVDSLEIDSRTDVHNLYLHVKASFETWWYSAIYILAFIFLGFHLVHGVYSAFRSLGLRNKKYVPAVKWLALALAILIPLGYTIIPVYFLINKYL